MSDLHSSKTCTRCKQFKRILNEFPWLWAVIHPGWSCKCPIPKVQEMTPELLTNTILPRSPEHEWTCLEGTNMVIGMWFKVSNQMEGGEEVIEALGYNFPMSLAEKIWILNDWLAIDGVVLLDQGVFTILRPPRKLKTPLREYAKKIWDEKLDHRNETERKKRMRRS